MFIENRMREFHLTPLGSHNWCVLFFYKHQIPSGLSGIQNGLAELKKSVE
jgi:hypothetical protein